LFAKPRGQRPPPVYSCRALWQSVSYNSQLKEKIDAMPPL